MKMVSKFSFVEHSGRLSGNLVMSGNVLLNGKKTRLDYGEVVSKPYIVLE